MRMFRNNPIRAAVFVLTLAVSTRANAEVIPIAVQTRSTPVDFNREILPILRKSCLACHSDSEANGGLVLETPAAMLKGGDTGPAVVPKNSEGSLLLELAAHRAKPQMPPAKNDVAAPDLTPQQLGLIKLWIDQGAASSSGSAAQSPEAWRPLPKGLQPIYAVAVTPDGQFAACGRANQIFVYHVATGQLVTRLTDPELQAGSSDGLPGIAHRDIVQSLAFNHAGDLLASGGFRVVKLWRRPRDLRSLQLAASEAVSAVAVSPDGSTAATASADHNIQLWRLPTGKPGPLLKGHSGAINTLQFSGDSRKLVSAASDKSLRIWDAAEGILLGRIDAAVDVQCLAVVTEDIPVPVAEGAPPATRSVERLVSGGADNFIRLWQFPASLPERLADVPAKSDVLAVSPDRKLLAIANPAGFVWVLNFETRELIQTWQAHAGAIHDVAFRSLPAPAAAPVAGEVPPVVTQLATAGADQTVRLWNYETGEPLGVLRGGLSPLRSVAWQFDGKRLVAGAADGSITVWNTEPAPLRSLEAGAGSATVSVLSFDGKLLATTGLSNDRPAIVVRDFATGAVTRTLLGHAAAITSIAWSADNTKLVSGSADMTARVWELADARFPEIARLNGHTAAVQGVAFSTDALQVLTGSADMSARLWKVADGTELMKFAGHTGPVVAVAMPANQPITAAADKTVRVWNPANGQQVRAGTAAAAITAMAVSRDNVQVALAGADNSIGLYPFANLQLRATLTGHAQPATSLAFSADNTRVVSGGADSSAIVWNVADGRLLEILPVEAGLSSVTSGPTAANVLIGDAAGGLTQHTLRFAAALNGITKPVTALAFSGNGQLVFTGSEDGTVRGFVAANGQPAFNANHGAPVHDLALSPSDQLLASAGENQLIRLWNTGGAPITPPQLAGFTGPVRSVAFSGDSTRVIGAGGMGAAGELHVFNLTNTGELEQSLVGHAGKVSAVVVAGGASERVVSAAADETVRIWELQAIRRIAGHTQAVSALAAIPGAPLQVISGSRDATVRRWNLLNGQLLLQLNHGGPVSAVAVRADGQRIASVSENNTGRLWNAVNGQQLAELRGDLRARALVAKLTQNQVDMTAKIAATKVTLTAAETLAPQQAAVAKTAADALAKANAEVVAKAAVVKQAADAKTIAEQAAIVAAATAQKASVLKAAADQAAVDAMETVLVATAKVTRAKAVAAAEPANAALAQTATAAQLVLDQASAKLAAANGAKPAPTKTAADSAAAAAAAGAAALAAGRPFVDATNLLRTAETAQKAAAQLSEFAARDAKAAAEAVPVIKADLAAAEARGVALKAELEAATKAALDAEKPLRTVAFSLDNLQLATGGDLGVIHTWNAETGVAVSSHVGHTGPIKGLAYTPGDGLLTGSVDKSAAVWDLNPGWVLERTIGKLDDPALLANRVMSLNFSQDDQLLATGGGVPSRSGELKLWKVADGSLVKDIPEPHTDIVYGVSLSHDGRFVATAGGDKYVRTFDVATGKQVQQFEGHTDHVLDVSWRADGKVLASSGADNMLLTWNPDNGDRIQTIAGFNKQVTAVRFIGATNITVACSADRTLRLHNVDNTGVVSTFAGTGGDFLYSADATPDRQFIVAGGFDGVLRIWNGNAANSPPLHQIEPPRALKPEAVLKSPAGMSAGK